MNTLEYILNKYGLELKNRTEIPNTGRDTLAAILTELGFKTGVEVGVQEGLYSEVLCRENTTMKFYGVDPWESYRTSHLTKKGAPSYATQEDCEKWLASTKARMAQYPNFEIIRAKSIDAVKKFGDETLDFVYIDGNHAYEFVADDLMEWSKKIRKGGIVSGHDYYKIANPEIMMQVKQAVDEYVTRNNIPLLIWGANARIEGTIRDKWRSWSFVKQ
jgi:hypothetical protein